MKNNNQSVCQGEKILQRVVFAILVVMAVLAPIIETAVFLRYILLAGSLIYLLMGWYFRLISDEQPLWANWLAGFVYATVFFASFMSCAKMPLAPTLVYLGMILSLALLVYVLYNRKTVRKEMLAQAIILLLISPIPLWV